MASEIAFDVVEEILVRLDPEDLIRCKSVCKSWQSLISSPRFVKAHLNRAYNNDRENHDLGHRRMAMPLTPSSIDDWIHCKFFHVVGTCNGLVCISPTNVELAVINPSTREVKKLLTPPYRPDMHKLDTICRLSMVRQVVCWGFGYDSSSDDYKVIAGFRKSYSKKRTLFYVLTLKSNIWKVIGQVKYRCIDGMDGILCGGSLHWVMSAYNKKNVILSLDLSTHEFREIPQPTADEEYDEFDDEDHVLGVMEECLCILSILSDKIWVMRNNNKWELLYNNNNNGNCENKYDVVHILNQQVEVDSHSYVCSLDDGTRVRSNGVYICTNIFVKSLVSPHPHLNNSYYEWNAKWQGQEVNKSSAKGGNIRRKRKRYSKYIKRALL